MSRQPNGGFIGTENITDNTKASGVYNLSEVGQKIALNEYPTARYTPSRSLRFDASRSTYLSRTPASAGNRRTWTWSGWVKRGALTGVRQALFTSVTTDAGVYWGLEFNANNNLNIFDSNSASGVALTSTRVFRDISAWYHIAVAVDTTQATASNRIKLYVNGEQITSFSVVNYSPLNSDTRINSTVIHSIGSWFPATGNTLPFDGYITDVNFVDGQSLTPSAFGEYEPRTNEWKPKRYAGTYGTNGFYLSFANNASTTTLGLDDGTGLAGSGAGSNDWTLVNHSVSIGANYDSMTDVPGVGSQVTNDIGGVTRGNYATMNPLDKSASLTITNGNLSITTASNAHQYSRHTIQLPTSGKWYWEVTGTFSSTSRNGTGIISNSTSVSDYPFGTSQSFGWYLGSNTNNWYWSNNGTLGFNIVPASGAVFQMCYDADNKTIYAGINNTFYNSAGSSSGSPSTLSNPTSSNIPDGLFPATGVYGSGTMSVNHGQRPFAYTPPAGFKSLCTTNLPEPVVKRPQDQFDIKLWNGNSTGITIGNTAKQRDNYQISRSLRFNQADQNQLSRVFGSTYTDKKKNTVSFWVKRSALNVTAGEPIMFYNNGGRGGNINFSGSGAGGSSANDDLVISNRNATTGVGDYTVRTRAIFREAQNWNHVVISTDTTQSVASDRIKIYYNGVRITDINTGDTAYPALNYESTAFLGGNAASHFIGFGQPDGSNQWFDGYLAEFRFIDGQALEPSSFGNFDVDGSWQAKAYTGTFGSNGFYLPFNHNATESFAGSFNGSNQFLSVPQNAAFSFGTGDFTVEAWVFANSWNSVNPIIALGDGAVGGGSPVYSGWALRYDSSGVIVFYRFDGTETRLDGSITLGTNAWNHIAVSRTSGTLRIFANGVQVYSAANSLSYNNVNSNTLKIGGNWVIGGGVVTWFNGLISNARIVKGTGLYTGNFIPTSSPLTAVTGTSLLTLQNSTIIDNSTNAFTITNNNTVTTSSRNPFAVPVITSDQSGNINSWFPANISAEAGINNDSMVDVPTDWGGDSVDSGGEVRANYPTILRASYSFGGQSTLTDGNLFYDSPNPSSNYAVSPIRATMEFSSGKYYYEVQLTRNPGANGGYQIGVFDVGAIPNTGGGWDTPSFGWHYNVQNGSITVNGVSGVATVAAAVSGDIIGLAFDRDAGTWRLYKNGTLLTTQTAPVRGTGWFFGANIDQGFSNSREIGFRFNFGQRPFVYTPPTDHKSLNTKNLNEQSPFLNGPDLVWIKRRNATSQNVLTDTVRGANRELYSNLTDAEQSNTGQFLTQFTSNGFLLGPSQSGTGDANISGGRYVGFCWNAGSRTVGNADGTITSTVRANPAAGFSIVNYTGTGANATVGHGLGVAPKMIISKSRTATTSESWGVYHASIPATNAVYLNLTQSQESAATQWNSTAPTSTVFSIGSATRINGSGASLVAYCFAEVAGYSSFGSFTGNGSIDGPFINTGFKPAWIMIKRIDSSSDWTIFDAATNKLFNYGTEASNRFSANNQNPEDQ
jgi:hypothetical protein